jgi:hypothetical protein
MRFRPDQDNLSPEHHKYRQARARLGVEHLKFHQLAAAAWHSSVTPAEAEADCGRLLEDIAAGKYEPERYLAVYVARVMNGEISSITYKSHDEGVIFDAFPRFEKDRRRLSVVVTGLPGDLTAAEMRRALA